MILILASIADEVAAGFAREFPAAAARVVTCLDLAMAPGALHHPRCEASRLTIGGEVVPLGRIRGVVNLLRGVDPGELLCYAEEEREYQASEFHALLTFLLSALPCPVVNRPTPLSLSGPVLNPLGWYYLARDAGIPLVGITVESAAPASPFPALAGGMIDVSCLGGVLIRSSGTPADEWTLRLARQARVEYLRARFSAPSHDALRFYSADGVPDLRCGATRQALMRHLIRGEP